MTPATPTTDDSSGVTLGVKFSSSTDGFITGIRFYKGNGNTGTHVGTLYSADGTALANVTFTNETASGWQTANFSSAVPVTAGTSYVAAYTAPNGHYAADSRYFGEVSHKTAVLTAPGGPSAQDNGVWGNPGSFPTNSYQSTNYYVDVVWSATDSTPLNASSTVPLAGSSSVSTAVSPSAIFNRAVTESSIAMTVADSSNNPVAGTVSYNATTRTASFNPTSPLVASTTYTATVMASAPGIGPMASPVAWTFTTARAAQSPGVCPCTVFDDTDAPTTGEADSSVELGMAFTSDTAGTITGIRFYKDPLNTGSHTISLWSAAGTQTCNRDGSQ